MIQERQLLFISRNANDVFMQWDVFRLLAFVFTYSIVNTKFIGGGNPVQVKRTDQ
jgi:hypothetical protein